ncbi:MAG: T9SS type A sorting domain-containing protein [Lentimicrobium sp.]
MKNVSVKNTFTVIIFLFLSGVPFIAASQVSREWVKIFNHKFEDRPASIALGANGNIYVAGRSQDDIAVMCYSPDGDSLGFAASPSGGNPAMGALILDDSCYVYVTGDDYASWPTSHQAVIRKWDPFGQLLGSWKRSLVGTSTGNAITLDDSSNVYVTGELLVSGVSNVFALKYNKSGVFQWITNIVFGPYSAGIDIELDQSGHAYVLAKSKDSLNGTMDFLLIKYDTTGDTLWSRRYSGGGPDNLPVRLQLDKAGYAYVSGYIYAGLEARDDFATLKYDPAGNLKWVETYNGPASYYDQVTDMCLDDSANVYVTGMISANTAELAVVKYDSSGTRKWTGRFTGQSGITSTGQICADKSGNVYATGSVSHNLDENIATVKFDRNGQLVWNIEYACTDSVWDRPTGVVADRLGNIYVLGNSASKTPGNSYDWVTIKYSQTENVLYPSRNGLNKPILDNMSTYDTITVSYARYKNYIADVNVLIDTIIHTNVTDLELYLIHQGTADTVICELGGSGENIFGMILDDDASTPVSNGSAPFTGSYMPVKPLSRFVNLDPTGNWILRIHDKAAGNTGTLKAWGLELTVSNAPLGIHEFNGSPHKYTLFQNYPNPFSETTVIHWHQAPGIGHQASGNRVVIKVFDFMGKEIRTLADGEMAAGDHQVTFDAKDLPSGVYYYRLQTETGTSTRKMILLK